VPVITALFPSLIVPPGPVSALPIMKAFFLILIIFVDVPLVPMLPFDPMFPPK